MKVLFVVLAVAVFAASAAYADVTVIGVISAGAAHTLAIDSVILACDTAHRSFITAGWAVDTSQYDTFVFPQPMPYWPTGSRWYMRIDNRIPRILSIPTPVPDSWYDVGLVQPPQPQIMIYEQVGLEENRGVSLRPVRLAATPSVSRGAVTLRATGLEPNSDLLQVYDAAGNAVCVLSGRSAGAGGVAWTWSGEDAGGRRVAEGVYYFRVVGEARAVARAVLTR